MTHILTASTITIHRGGRTLFRDMALSVPRGSLTAITGPNGCGKSTLAWCLGLFGRAHDSGPSGTDTETP